MTMLLPGMPVTYGMPMSPMMMPGAMPYGGMFGQPVMISSMSQLPPGAVPVSQDMLAQALGVMPTPEKQPSVLGRVVKGVALGAVGGALFGAIPFLPPGPMVGAAIGGAIGGVAGLVTGLIKKTQENEFHTMSTEQQKAIAMAQMASSTPPGARSAAATASSASPVDPPRAARRKVVMGPEMRKRWAAKVRAERAAAAKAAKASAT